MAKDNCRHATHLYVAKVGRYSKFGISVNPQARCQFITAEGFGKAAIVRTWELKTMSSTVEWLVAQQTVKHRILHRIEYLRLPVADLIAIVDAAVSAVETGNYEKPPHILRREKREQFWKMLEDDRRSRT